MSKQHSFRLINYSRCTEYIECCFQVNSFSVFCWLKSTKVAERQVDKFVLSTTYTFRSFVVAVFVFVFAQHKIVQLKCMSNTAINSKCNQQHQQQHQQQQTICHNQQQRQRKQPDAVSSSGQAGGHAKYMIWRKFQNKYVERIAKEGKRPSKSQNDNDNWQVPAMRVFWRGVEKKAKSCAVELLSASAALGPVVHTYLPQQCWKCAQKLHIHKYAATTLEKNCAYTSCWKIKYLAKVRQLNFKWLSENNFWKCCFYALTVVFWRSASTQFNYFHSGSPSDIFTLLDSTTFRKH